MRDERASLKLYRTHRTALVTYASAITGSPAQAEDVVQDAWLKLEHAADPESIIEPVSYLFRIVRNLAVDARRALTRENARSGGVSENLAAILADEHPSPEQTAVARDEVETVLKALAELPERTQIAVRLNRMEGKKLREVAEHLGISITRAHILIAEGVAHCDRRRTARLKLR